MAKYVDKPLWEEEVLIPDTSTPVLGGQPVWEQDQFVDGFYNVPIAILADRTRHLKNRIDGVEQEVTEGLEGFLIAEENLADLTDVAQAKYNLGLNLVDNTSDADKPISTDTQAALNSKVDIVAGKGLSTEDFTTTEKSKLAGIATGATANTGTVTSINVAVPTGLQVAGGPITNSGTITVSYASGYAIPTTTKQGQWDTAYGWGNHSTAGYALSSSLAPVATSGNWADVANKPAVMAVGATQQEARDAIGAGTSDLQIGTTASTAKAGNYSPTSATKENVLQGSSSSVFVTPSSYFNVISWATASPSGTVTLDLDSSLNHDLTVSGSVTMASPSNADVGKTGDIVIRMTANGAVSWNPNWKFLGSVPDIGESGEMWVISYKVLSGTEILASANKVAS
ncbi:MAG: hypothetical protein M0R77_08115 [Gammaproteobacteria bacterium]|nr:hypothetical protein [Gammaproteobacteria bacterium]